jgi:hypothetical protein
VRKGILFKITYVAVLLIPLLYHFYLRETGYSKAGAWEKSGIFEIIAIVTIGIISQFDKVNK